MDNLLLGGAGICARAVQHGPGTSIHFHPYALLGVLLCVVVIVLHWKLTHPKTDN